MVTRSFSAREVRDLRQELGGLRSSITGNILPALGLGAALGFMSGGMLDSTSSGLALSSAGFELTSTLYRLQEQIAALLLPIAEELFPVLSDAVDWFTDLNEETDGWALRVAALAVAARLAYGPISSLIRLLLTPAGVGTAIGAAGAAVSAAAGASGEALADRLGLPRRFITGSSLSLGGPIGLPPVPIDEILELVGLISPEAGARSRFFLENYNIIDPQGRGTGGRIGVGEETPHDRAVRLFQQGGARGSDVILDRLRAEQEARRNAPTSPQSQNFLQHLLGLDLRGAESTGGPFGLQGDYPAAPPRLDPVAFPPAPQQPPQNNTTNNFYFQSYDDQQLIRHIQSLFDQGAVDTGR